MNAKVLIKDFRQKTESFRFPVQHIGTIVVLVIKVFEVAHPLAAAGPVNENVEEEQRLLEGWRSSGEHLYYVVSCSFRWS